MYKFIDFRDTGFLYRKSATYIHMHDQNQTSDGNPVVRVKDYLVTPEDLYFAVVSDITESGKILCDLRYADLGQGEIRKFTTESANRFLSEKHPQYLYHSRMLDVNVHAVPETLVRRLLKPVDTVKRLLGSDGGDDKTTTARSLVKLLLDRGMTPDRSGITGSLMPGFHGGDSDIDIVIYGQREFWKLREIVKSLLSDDRYQLDDVMWWDAWKRRNCDLEFEEYKRYESRKFNKINFQGTKTDFSCIPDPGEIIDIKYPLRKLPARTVRCRVTDDSAVFSYPARYAVDHSEIQEVLAYTATFTGQAFTGEEIEARGPVEVDDNNRIRMVIGTSREAPGEYIRVPGKFREYS